VTKSHDETTGEVGQPPVSGSMGPAAWAAIGSVALALYFYYVRGDKQRGQFIGLWPATILSLAAYRKLDEIARVVRHGSD